MKATNLLRTIDVDVLVSGQLLSVLFTVADFSYLFSASLVCTDSNQVK